MTVVTPIGNVLPGAGMQVTGRTPSTRSVAVAVNVTTAPAGVVAVAEMFAGTVSDGGVVSPPRPASVVVAVPPVALEIVSVADFAPTPVGVNVTPTDADPPGAIIDVVGAVAPKAVASGPLTS